MNSRLPSPLPPLSIAGILHPYPHPRGPGRRDRDVHRPEDRHDTSLEAHQGRRPAGHAYVAEHGGHQVGLYWQPDGLVQDGGDRSGLRPGWVEGDPSSPHGLSETAAVHLKRVV